MEVNRNKVRGTGASRVWVPAAGRLTVFGKGVKKQTITVPASGFQMAKLVPKGAYRARLRSNHRGFTIVTAKSRSAPGARR